jgi:hypothetical protein
VGVGDVVGCCNGGCARGYGGIVDGVEVIDFKGYV